MNALGRLFFIVRIGRNSLDRRTELKENALGASNKSYTEILQKERLIKEGEKTKKEVQNSEKEWK